MSHKTISHTSSRGSQGPSLDRQITLQDVECLREAFALFDADRKEAITGEELGKVRYSQVELLLGLLSFTVRFK